MRLPDGQITDPAVVVVQPLPKKYSDFPKAQIRGISLAIPSHTGAARDRHGRGAGCGGREAARSRAPLERTAKSCGPDAPTLASSFADKCPPGDGDKKSPVTEESSKEA